jgi:hypothetical protein
MRMKLSNFITFPGCATNRDISLITEEHKAAQNNSNRGKDTRSSVTHYGGAWFLK